MNYFGLLNDYLPITVLAALVLFVIKELFECVKRALERRRKLAVYKKLIVEELAKNSWALQQLLEICKQIDSDDFIDTQYVRCSSGSELLIIKSENTTSEIYYWKIHSSAFDRLMVDLATIDPHLFNSVALVYESLAEAKFVRDMFIEFTDLDRPVHLKRGLANHGKVEVGNAHNQVDRLYREITGKDSVEHKLRSFI